MRKRILLKQLPGRPRAALRGWATAALAPLLRALPVARAKLCFSDEALPLLSVPRLAAPSLAMVSLWEPEEGALTRLREALDEELGELEEHEVQSSAPLSYEKRWADGALSPGATLLTLFEPARGLEPGEFQRRWHEEHTPMALSIHPLWNYERNRVLRTLRGRPWGGIVEEHARERADLIRPWRFFGSPLWMVPNMIRVGLHARTFLDLGTVQNHLMKELWIRS